ncbi:transcription anti-termination factor NusG [Mycoplasmopsis canis UFG4]|uniref:Transcription termination/antitermination protein NusG n=2 Tax=Mycoplasmopsis canis TaxID=29555 RepID=I1A5V7_9BACT|nr:transcription termination/antitermination protein NusG [Mycoplasmopsis canis]AKF40943.1 antitermination protein NusG [Mycoplasmopsis canis]AMD81057.1 transcription termination/antitermination protein NusG [Mycoplasmopsis canis PG 14]EIE39883.1 transcription anti-termination factor NusG [Mycoplasmopsis canis PG 14]EIE40098.1 transcription anti-termination factor NusG [Mycoplasmopsis canis UF31]EIE40310.1 transcription anti-termination factor NusG [Mycoplasmopsis canis UF33]
MTKLIRWYMISTIRGKEDQVLESLNNRIQAENMLHDFDLNANDGSAFKIFKKPTLSQKEFQKKNEGLEYKVKYVNLYPGYIFAKMHMSDEAWFLIRNTQYVTGLIGSSGKGAKPTPLSSLEIKKMKQQEEEFQRSFDAGENVFGYSVGDVVEIIDGIYIGKDGEILSINSKENTVTLKSEGYGKQIEIIVSMEIIRRIEE